MNKELEKELMDLIKNEECYKTDNIDDYNFLGEKFKEMSETHIKEAINVLRSNQEYDREQKRRQINKGAVR